MHFYIVLFVTYFAECAVLPWERRRSWAVFLDQLRGSAVVTSGMCQRLLRKITIAAPSEFLTWQRRMLCQAICNCRYHKHELSEITIVYASNPPVITAVRSADESKLKISHTYTFNKTRLQCIPTHLFFAHLWPCFAHQHPQLNPQCRLQYHSPMNSSATTPW